MRFEIHPLDSKPVDNPVPQPPEQQENEAPYIFEIVDSHRSLTYIGALHSFDPTHLQYQLIQTKWSEFIRKHASGKKVALVEGGTRPVHATAEAAITQDSEAGFTTFLANNAGIEVASPEPPRDAELEALHHQFNTEEIALYYAARLIAQWHRLTEKPPVEEYIEATLNTARTYDSGQAAGPLTLEHLQRVSHTLLGRWLGEGDAEFWKRIADPTLTESRINAIAKASSDFRDAHIMSEINHRWRGGESLFVVYGRNHATDQEAALRVELAK